MADTEKKPYVAPNGKHVVKLKVRFEQHNAGEVCGFEEKVVRELTAKNYAEHYEPTDEERAQHDAEKAEANGGKPVPKPAATASSTSKPGAK